MFTDGRTNKENVVYRCNGIVFKCNRKGDPVTRSNTVKFKKIALSNIKPLEKDKYYVNVPI